ncbi:MAG: thiamine phosphate synthase, partial [Muribaculaceae bacterium]|nr:thiamine phosphate synthase [Muribaculaceae bacterium]
MDKFLIIVITSDKAVDDEAKKIETLLRNGVDIVHLRKPDWSLREVRDLIESIDYRCRNRIRLHGHFELLNEMNLGGAHLNHRNPVAPATAKAVSRSCHSIDELERTAGFDYVTLSPIFDSISKSGYTSRFDLASIGDDIIRRRVVALGGVTAESLLSLYEKGFIGAAVGWVLHLGRGRRKERCWCRWG